MEGGERETEWINGEKANKSKDELEQNKQEYINERWFWIFTLMYIKTELKPKNGFQVCF